MRRRVVVTGLGAVTPVGNDVASTWQALLAGKSGAADITRFDATKYSVRFACEVKGFDALAYMDRKEAKRADAYSHLAVAASLQAAADAGITPGSIMPESMGVIIGSGIGGIRSFEDQHDVYRTLGPGKISPFFIPMFIGDIAAGLVSMRLQAKGPNYSTVSACASSANAIGDAFRIIQYGDADVMVAGGAEAAVTPMSIGGFANMGALSTRNDAPAEASRPFDLDRDGFVMGEGAGVVILEELEHARKRGARIYGEVVGFRSTGDAYHLTGQPEAHEGLQRAMRGAMQDGGLVTTDVDYINAHGTSTPLNDPNESKGIKVVFGEHAHVLSISSTKSATGHMLGAAGAVEFLVCALAIRDNMVPPTINYHTPDPECDLDYTPNTPRARKVDVALSNSSGFGGHNVSLALRRWHA